jgi:beta-phosphoglucomutase-like phosphatase (HAD superfamily)
MEVIISRPEIIQHKAGADLIHRAAQKMNVAIDNVLFISPYPSEVRAVQRVGAITAWMRTGQRTGPAASTGDFKIENIAEGCCTIS